jgi:hypothetical protein
LAANLFGRDHAAEPIPSQLQACRRNVEMRGTRGNEGATDESDYWNEHHNQENGKKP